MESIIKDRFEIKGRVALEYGAAGVVAVFELALGAAEPSPGEPILIQRPDGWMAVADVGEVKEHGGQGRSCFLRGFAKEDIPIGSALRWGKDVWPDVASVRMQSTAREHAAIERY